MVTIDRERILALRAGAEGANPHGNVAIRTDDFLYLTALAMESLKAASTESRPPLAAVPDERQALNT